jgi:HPt (histidine-containing phosphotransfer) domain-containing protein
MSPAVSVMPSGLDSCAGAEALPVAFDLAVLVRRCMDDSALAVTLLEKFTSRLTKSIQEIELLLDAEDWPAATAKVHDLKGEAGSLAADGLHAELTALERCLRVNLLIDARASLARAEAAAEQAITAAPAALTRLSQWIPPINHRS